MQFLRKKQLARLIVIQGLCLAVLMTAGLVQQVEAGNPLLKRKMELRPVNEKMAARQLAEYLGWLQSQHVDGTSEDDVIMTGGGDDKIQSFAGDDRIYSSFGDDEVRSGPGNDYVAAGPGDDYVLAGSGDDLVYGNSGDDYLGGGDGNDVLYGDQGNDRLYGDDGNDCLYGGSGSDILKGEAGNDLMDGGDGQDELYSRGGNDVMFGGADADDFMIRPSGAVEQNVIIDFTPGVDLVDLSHPGIQIVDFADLLSHCVETVHGVSISLPTNNSSNDTLLLIGITLADLDPQDFDI